MYYISQIFIIYYKYILNIIKYIIYYIIDLKIVVAMLRPIFPLLNLSFVPKILRISLRHFINVKVGGKYFGHYCLQF